MSAEARLFCLVTVALALFAVGCKGESRIEDAPADLRPVADEPPYLCDLVPESSFRRVTGIAAHVSDGWAGPQTDNGLCLAGVSGDEGSLGVNWSYNDGDKTIRFQQETWSKQPTHPFPPELGKGLAVVKPTAGAIARPNYVIAVFTCGEDRPWIRIDFAPVTRGRDAVQDMFAFMRIAQKRFGELHKCTPRAS
ncbi:hypothetical protein [Spirillospora albida]|uniref:hypothetical protein n=1 Tax=Spirillospora albida TaxID=58123 RepID=UPI0012F8FC45|nr:hypothetical protein [Spirillospora albida]